MAISGLCLSLSSSPELLCSPCLVLRDCARWDPRPAEGPAPCHPVHRPGLQLSRTNTEGETTESPAIGVGQGTRPAEELMQGQKALGAAQPDALGDSQMFL